MRLLLHTICLLYTLSTSLAVVDPWLEEDRQKLESGELLAGSMLFSSPIDFDDDTSTLPQQEEPIEEEPLIVRPIPAQPEDHELPGIDDDRVFISQALIQRYFDQAINEKHTQHNLSSTDTTTPSPPLWLSITSLKSPSAAKYTLAVKTLTSSLLIKSVI